MKSEVRITMMLDKDVIDWIANTFPGLSRSWLVNRMLLRFKERFNNEHYVDNVIKASDETYDQLKDG